MNYMKIQKMILGLMFQKFIGIILLRKFLTLDKVDGISIREHELIRKI